MPPGGEIICLHVGQAGCQLGNVVWELFCLEHCIRPDGIMTSRTDSPYVEHLDSFFSRTGAGKIIPRACFIDLEPSVVDEIRTGRFRELYHPQDLITGKEDAASCFARGYFTLAKDVLDLILGRIRMMADECEKPQGFLVYRAFGGGTGSGLTTRVLEKIYQDFPKKSIFEFAIYPAPRLSPVIVEPYNTSIATHVSLEFTDGTFIVDNEAIYDICDRLLDIRCPSYNDINRLMAQVISSVTSSFRFEGTVNVDFNEIKTNLIPFPRMQYPILSYSPLISKRQVLYENSSESALLSSCFVPSNQFVKCDPTKGKYMACNILFRGDVNNASINAALASVKAKKSIRFAEWCPTGFKVGVNDSPPLSMPTGDLALMSRVCLMMANSSAMKTVWSRINYKFDLIFSKKAFLYWYIMEGLEEGDFQESRLDLGALESDYAEVESGK